MKLLLDENLSRRILPLIEQSFPKSTQVVYTSLESEDDKQLWQYAKNNNFTIVTKDSDFHEMSIIYGHPPKIIWLKCGNQTKQYIANILIQNEQSIKKFNIDNSLSCLEIY
jgi:predicted nuclease of predicted toxin-antitoxin system